MKKVAIVTMIGNNYGNRLQNFAVQEIYKRFGLQPETIKNPIRYRAIIKNILRDRILNDRTTQFHVFDKKYIQWSRYSFQDDYSLAYDYYSIGSDQVWNTNWYERTPSRKDNYLLTFAKPSQRLCMSPSFGIAKLPDCWKMHFKDQLSLFPKLSVRELSGARIIKELTGKDAEVLIDPTLMLEKEKWFEIAKAPVKINTKDPYILTYFLGDTNPEAEKRISDIRKSEKLNVISLMSPEMKKQPIGPSEFIYLIANAKIVITDSFHACVFSFLFSKPFLVYSRLGNDNDMDSRISTLCEKFELQRKYTRNNLENDIFECNYSEGYKCLDVEREKFLRFLNESLNDMSQEYI